MQLRRSIFTVDFLFIFLLVPILNLKANFFLATYNEQISFLSDDPKVIAKYQDMLGWMIPAIGMSVTPLGAFPDRFGVNSSIILLLVMSASEVACSLSANLHLQIFRFVLFSIWFPFMFATWVTFQAHKFGYKHFGTISGIIATTCGAVAFANKSIIDYATETGQLGYRWVATWQIVICGIFLILGIFLWVWTIYKGFRKRMDFMAPYVG